MTLCAARLQALVRVLGAGPGSKVRRAGSMRKLFQVVLGSREALACPIMVWQRVFLFLFPLMLAEAAAPGPRPNFVYILMDDTVTRPVSS